MNSTSPTTAAPPLPKRPLGQTGMAVSCLGLGTVKFGRNQGVKYPTGFTLPDDSQISDLLALARDLGINLLDTAPAYGSSEERIGKLLTERERWLLCSKAGETFADGKSTFDFSATAIRHSVERSLRRLCTDYLDILLIHSDGQDEHIINETGCIQAMQDMKQQGLIRATGMSTKTIAGGMLAAHLCDVLMLTYNPQAIADLPVIQKAGSLNKGILIKKALNSGHAVSETSDAVAPGTKSLRFALTPPAVSSVIVGTITPRHLKSNAAAVTDS